MTCAAGYRVCGMRFAAGLMAFLGVVAPSTLWAAQGEAAQSIKSRAMSKEANMLLHDHPLVGQIWHPASGKQVNLDVLRKAVTGADYLLLGEKHDNELHHLRQAQILSMVTAARTGQGGRLAMEMAEDRYAGILSKASPETVDGLGAALKWEERGWPDWTYYKPVVETALKARFALKPGNPDRQLVLDIGRGGSLDKTQQQGLLWERDYDPAQREDLLEELVAAHCGMMGKDALGPLVTMQRLKDAHMARAMREGRKVGAPSVLIAGNGHVRKDRAVPMFLDEGDKESKIVSIALIEVVRDAFDPKDYQSFDASKYDFVWFTPRIDEIDPCEKFRGQLERMKKKMDGHGKGQGQNQDSDRQSDRSPAPTSPKDKLPEVERL